MQRQKVKVEGKGRRKRLRAKAEETKIDDKYRRQSQNTKGIR